MQDNTTGTPPQTDLSQTGNQSAAELATQQAAQAASSTAQSNGASQEPDIESLQAELAREREAKAAAEAQRLEYETRFKDTQAAYTQARQQLQALAGAVPRPDPLQTCAAEIMRKHPDLDERAAYIFAEHRLDFEKHRLEMDQLRQEFQGRLQAPNIAQQVFSAAIQSNPKIAQAFQDPAVANEVMQQLTYDAQNGSRIDPALATHYAYMALGKRAIEGSQQSPQQPRVAAPAFNSFTGPTGGFQPAPPVNQQTFNPEAEALAKQMAAYTRIPLK